MGFESSSENYTVGKGQLFFNRKLNGVYEGMRNLGNVVSLNTSVEVEKLDHFATKSKFKTKDKSVVVEISPGLKIVLDEINAENFALLFMGTIEEVDQVSASGKTATIPAANVKKGRYADIGAVFLDSKGTFTVTDDGATKTYVAGTDYRVDWRTGKLQILSGGSIAEGADLKVTYDLAAQKYKVISSFAEGQIEGELFYASDNAAGSNQQITFWSVSLSPAGDSVLITEGAEWMQIELEGEVQADYERDPEKPFGKVIIID